ncbi:conserved hypothetical protein [Talaromyces stipitatus ATCC 10500]|uniref:Uncharacterized protein n=1 Tax=Talaromyces stipitatus (strain ATCC 10500 / CBS 375.48 / QM 6759 / NRRL 1006) TaxID=441959 RepID=B8MCS5_TALSN|nr:uncharacterized protein TSTA_126850 [Talaromyces stipitatus ATCC 10500]EED18977.1 conserved hypothetical protein [Talaromyces stipitatus ATCC 10500]
MYLIAPDLSIDLVELPETVPGNNSFCDHELFMFRPATRKITNFTIEIVSDPVCSWCYIGKKKLDNAIKIHQSSQPDNPFIKIWKPFYVKPHSSEIGKQLFSLIHLKTEVPILPNFRKQHGEIMANMMIERVRIIGADISIEFKFSGRTGRTHETH